VVPAAQNKNYDRMSHLQYDIIILGAGPAGTSCALALKESGLNVALIDKDTFPRDKICGDAVSSVAKRVLREIDPMLEQDLLAFPEKSNVNTIKLYSPGFSQIRLQFKSISHCIRRMDFDHWLFQKTIEYFPALNIHTGTAVKKVEHSGTSVTVTMADGVSMTATLLIACDGAHSLAAKQLAGFTVDRKHYSAAVRQYYRNISGMEEGASEIFFLKDYLQGYFWIFPLSSNEANVGFGMLSSTIAEKKVDLRKCMQTIIRDVPEIAGRFAGAEPLDEIKGFGLPLGSRTVTMSGDRFMLCGDAASLIDPFSGEGIPTAMESGLMAAKVAVRCFQRNSFGAEELRQYDHLVRTKFGRSFRNHYILQRMLDGKKWLIETIFALCSISWVNRNLPKWFY
jgi:geranylgeranyl reductase family protein